MPELLTESTPGQSGLAHWPRRLMWALASVLLLGSIPAVSFAQTVPSALRTCAAETDAGQRLDCYDREMARLLAPQKQPKAGVKKPDLPASVTPTQASSSRPTQASSLTPAQVSSSAPAQTPSSASAPHRSSLWKSFSGGGASDLTARIARLERWPDAMVLHLDNGQVWQQIGRASGDLSLQAGDTVKIEKHFGSYWLSSGHITDMQVRLKSQ
ncbi:MAG: hypothetical protein ACRET5_18930 [Steroidobacteraceae bacterium]